MLDGTQSVSGVTGTLPVLGMLFVAVILIVYGSHIFSKYIAAHSFKMAQSKHLKVLDRIVVGQDRFLIVVQADNRYFLVGVSSGQMTCLAELSKEDFEQTEQVWQSHKEATGFHELLKEKWKTKIKK